MAQKRNTKRKLSFFMTAVACLGGDMDRNSDPPLGTTVIWQGFTRWADLSEGFRIAGMKRPTLMGK